MLCGALAEKGARANHAWPNAKNYKKKKEKESH